MALHKNLDIKKIIEEKRDLPVLSNIIAKVLELTRNEHVEINEIANVVKNDLALSAKILKVVNSPYYGFPRKIVTISQAMVILGMDSIKNLSISLSVVSAFPKTNSFNYKFFWKTSFYSAIAARLIASHTNFKDPEEAFVAGLMHDLGTILLGIYLPDQYNELIKLSPENDSKQIKQEEYVFNTNHTEFGEILALKWNLPESLTNVIRYHHSVDLWDIFPEQQKLLLQIVYLSDILTKIFLEKDPMGRNIINFNMEARRLFRIDDKTADDILKETTGSFESTVKYFSLDMTFEEKQHTEIIMEVNKELAKINLSYEQIMHNIYNRNVTFDQGKKLEKEKQVEILTKETNEYGAFQGMIGNSVEMLKLFSTIREVAKYTSTILINGETGTGKELVASAIHELSPRKENKYIAFNLGSIDSRLIESELFGHEKGAFTGADSKKIGLFEAANNGTIFLDEIGELAMPLQVNLLRVLENRTIRRVGSTTLIPIDVRVLAATNKDLEEEVKRGNFREDLFYRINVISIKLLKLNERKEDILPLCEYYLKKINKKFNKDVAIPDEILNLFLRYPWDGNVRELINIIESAVLKSSGRTVTLESLPVSFKNLITSEFDEINESNFETLENVEKKHINRILKMLDGNKVQAAKVLGLGRSSLYRKIEKYKLIDYL